jgi:hypothetical protein
LPTNCPTCAASPAGSSRGRPAACAGRANG